MKCPRSSTSARPAWTRSSRRCAGRRRGQDPRRRAEPGAGAGAADGPARGAGRREPGPRPRRPRAARRRRSRSARWCGTRRSPSRPSTRCSPRRPAGSGTPRSAPAAPSAAASPTPTRPPSCRRSRSRPRRGARRRAGRRPGASPPTTLFTGALQYRPRRRRRDDHRGRAPASPARWGFAEFARRHGDFALVSAVVAEFGDRLRVVVGGVAGVAAPGRPVRSAARPADGAPAPWTTTAREAADAARRGRARRPTCTAAPAYRRAMTAEMVRRALAQSPGSR